MSVEKKRAVTGVRPEITRVSNCISSGIIFSKEHSTRHRAGSPSGKGCEGPYPCLDLGEILW